MSTEAISAVDADLARVDAAQASLVAARGEEVPVGTASPGELQRGHAAVAAAEAALAQAQAALNAAQAAAAAADATAGAGTPAASDHATLAISPAEHHLVDSLA